MNKIKLIDIGANLTDSMYQGIYNGHLKHPPDLVDVIKRAFSNGLSALIITGTNLQTSSEAAMIAANHDNIYFTVGTHPTNCDEFLKSDETAYLSSLKSIIDANLGKVAAIGEIGLDYERLNFCSKQVQKRYFEFQLGLAKLYEFPLFVHCRNAHDDLLEILNRTIDLGERKVIVHSFTGTAAEASRLIEAGCFIGLNGCSLKTEDNLRVINAIPMDRILIETGGTEV